MKRVRCLLMRDVRCCFACPPTSLLACLPSASRVPREEKGLAMVRALSLSQLALGIPTRGRFQWAMGGSFQLSD